MNLTALIPAPYRILALAIFAVALYGGGYVSGLCHEASVRDAKDAIAAKQDTEQHAKDVDRARAKEQALRDALDAETEKRNKEAADHAKQMEALRAAARAGTERLRCPTALPADTQAANPAAASGPVAEARSGELVPGAADAVFRIAASIGDIVRERNALIDTYNKARETCNAP